LLQSARRASGIRHRSRSHWPSPIFLHPVKGGKFGKENGGRRKRLPLSMQVRSYSQWLPFPFPLPLPLSLSREHSIGFGMLEI
jgi:hypothetical protein